MHLDGFAIRHGYLLTIEGQDLDLHNDYELVAADHDPSAASVRVTFARLDEARVPEGVPRRLVLRFDAVSRLVYRAGDPALTADRRTLSFIGFLDPDDESMEGWLEALADASQDLIVGMEDRSAIRIQAARVGLEVGA